MSRVCEVCGKGGVTGNRIIRKGLAKKKGGIGLHVTAVTRRKFLPNLQKIRCIVNGGVKSQKVCTACIRAGKIKKA